MEELKPCPFCGGEAKLTGYSSAQSMKKYGNKIHWVICANKCKASGYEHDTKEKIIKAWNKRA